MKIPLKRMRECLTPLNLTLDNRKTGKSHAQQLEKQLNPTLERLKTAKSHAHYLRKPFIVIVKTIGASAHKPVKSHAH